MLHIRYDWRRPVFWAAVCLTFFLSSQTPFNAKNESHSIELVREATQSNLLTGNEVEQKLYESSFATYFNIPKK
jgi:hypothetical protein